MNFVHIPRDAEFKEQFGLDQGSAAGGPSSRCSHNSINHCTLVVIFRFVHFFDRDSRYLDFLVLKDNNVL